MAALISRGVGAAASGRSWAVVALAAAALVGAAVCGPVRAEPQRRASEFWLDNGMQVVVVPDHRAPVVTHVVWYRVGGADNALGQSGIAHFLEHLMFRSTKKLKSGELERTVSRLGGRDNAVTSHDATYYFQRLPSEHLKTAMVMEADRMRNLNLVEDEVATERDVVLQERRSVVDSKPLAILDELINANLYLNHPYRIPVLGWEHEMKKLNRAAAIAFYRRYYAPNNAILVVAGDVTPDQVKKLAQEVYGPIKRQPGASRDPRPTEPPQRGVRRIELKDARVNNLALQRYYMTPSYKSAEGNEAEALDTLSIILGDGPTSRLYRQLVDEKNIAANAGASFSAVALDGGTLTLYAVAGDGVKQETLEQALDASIAQFIKDGPSDEELEQAKNAMIASYVYSADNQAGLAQRYGSNLVIGRSIADIEEWPNKVGRVTAADVKKVAAKYLVIESSVTGYLVPERSADDAASEDHPAEAHR
ncbi:MAG TPA: pitrilysin family protein [Hyphomicrobiaceae bacterium]|nr:pitrilysin family protein [Hyphomicrobiaceae bacterium]